jgi:Flp pilus assembly protein TadB
MAQTKKRRRRKRKGTQGGRIDTNRRAARPRTREEAKARARTKRKPTQRGDLPPTWRGSIMRGLVAAAIFAVLLLLIFRRPVGVSIVLGLFMLAFYIPAGYFIDMAMWRRRERARIREQGDR